MGGKAFAQCAVPILVPRLPPDLYRSIRDHCLSLLSAICQRVATPTAAPGKSSHGDIDILVAAPIRPAIAAYLDHQGLTSCCAGLPDYVHAVKHLMDAQHLIYSASNPITTFAVPHPGSTPGAFVQVDITLCPETNFEWQRCLNSHGDFWMVARRVCMSYGLSFTDSGIHLRDELIEKYEWSNRFLVGADATAILEFLDLDVNIYWQDEGFGSKEAMFDFLSSMRFFTPEVFISTKDRSLNSAERKKFATREDYRLFCEEYAPKLMNAGAAPEATRKEVQHELVAIFGRQQAWDEHKAAWWRKYWGEKAKQWVNRLRREMLDAKAWDEEAYLSAWTGFLAQPGA